MTAYESQREEADPEFYTSAVDIWVSVSKLMKKTDVVPKSSRFTIAVPIVETARSAVYNVRRGIEFFPNSEENVAKRKHYYTLAIADFKMLQEDINCLKKVASVRLSTFDKLISALKDEVAILKNTRKNTRVRGR